MEGMVKPSKSKNRCRILIYKGKPVSHFKKFGLLAIWSVVIYIYIKIKFRELFKKIFYTYWHKIPSKATKSAANTIKIGQHQNDSSINVSVTKRPCEGSWTYQHESGSEPEIELFNIIDHNEDTFSALIV